VFAIRIGEGSQDGGDAELAFEFAFDVANDRGVHGEMWLYFDEVGTVETPDDKPFLAGAGARGEDIGDRVFRQDGAFGAMAWLAVGRAEKAVEKLPRIGEMILVWAEVFAIEHDDVEHG